MKRYAALLALLSLALPGIAACQSPPKKLCKALTAFVSSVQPNKTHKVEFHTSWGGGFATSPKGSIGATECDFYGYDPALAVCRYLARHGAVEFAGVNVKHALVCLSKGTHFTRFEKNQLRLHLADFTFTYGTPQRGSIVTIYFGPDKKLGGMVLRVVAEGY